MFYKKFLILWLLLLFCFVLAIQVQAADAPAKTPASNCPVPNPVQCVVTKQGKTVQFPVYNCQVGGVFDPCVPLDVQCACCGQCTFASFTSLASRVATMVLGIVGSLALAAFVYGGFMMILAAGDANKITKGKQALTAAVIGVIIVLGAYTIISYGLKALTGRDLNDWQSQVRQIEAQK